MPISSPVTTVISLLREDLRQATNAISGLQSSLHVKALQIARLTKLDFYFQAFLQFVTSLQVGYNYLTEWTKLSGQDFHLLE